MISKQSAGKNVFVAVFILLALGAAYWFSGKYSNTLITKPSISSFEECAKAGNVVMESYPRQCRTSDGQLFIEQIAQTCRNLCGDGVCQEMVCQSVGCPCSESADSCPVDCSASNQQ